MTLLWMRPGRVLNWLAAASMLVCGACRGAPPVEDPAPTQADLEALRNTNRVLIVFAPTFDDARFEAQQRLWSDAKVGFADRDLVVLQARSSTSELSSTYGIEPATFAVVLVGKDGHTAFRWDVPVAAADIFGRIDAMPMRKEEVRQRGR